MPSDQNLEDIGREQDLLSLPEMARVERHVLDESQFQAVLPGKQPQRDDIVFGHSAHGDGVDLHRMETGVLGRQDSFDHLLETRCGASIAQTWPRPSCPG